MKQYDAKISHAALSDMEQIYSYIADRLLEPDTAMGQYLSLIHIYTNSRYGRFSTSSFFSSGFIVPAPFA